MKQNLSFQHPQPGADSSQLLQAIMGAQSLGSGALANQPFLSGLGGSNLNILVNGIAIPNACPNEMMPAMSYLPPSQVGKITVYPTVAPVTRLTGALGGAISVSSPAPVFASAGQHYTAGGSMGAFYQSNGDVHGENLSLYGAGTHFSIRYDGSLAQGNNVHAAAPFKTAVPSISAKTIGSTYFRSENQSLTLAGRWQSQLLELRVSHQHIPYEGFPNVRMDLANNSETTFQLHYLRKFSWGQVDTRLYNELIQHEMNLLGDKEMGPMSQMPMYTQATQQGLRSIALLRLDPQDSIHLGLDLRWYHLNDWWTPVAGSPMMRPDIFWNIRNGHEDHYDVLADWEHHWSRTWMSRIGLRLDQVETRSGPVQGYNPMMYGNPAMADSLPGRFNRSDRARSFSNWDASAILRYAPSQTLQLELGLARTTQAPNLYELYTWSDNPMAMNMNGWFGDGNGYIGNLRIKAQTNNTLSLHAGLRSATAGAWQIEVNPYFSYIQNYIGVQRCPVGLGGACTTANLQASRGFVYLQFVNQNAEIWGVNANAKLRLLQTRKFGDFDARAQLAFVQGQNLSTHAPLYRIMPLEGLLTLQQDWGPWQNWIGETLVAAKGRADPIRNEVRTPGYGLLDLGTRFTHGSWQASLSLLNLLNQFYYQPLGGAYLGQKPYAWGIAVPGQGRSVNLSLNYRF
ncbi:TonB-dependent receptor plug domain-containing protein [Acidithiobacillus sp. M4-SHS-6]|uniref:TonB-dependent receptor plug domain-containing protein n=1 Tax=Acidithiobacillus sp. M4-SHS-6 TaxID=3383024 RepID=UPI0039BE5EAB